MGDGVELPVESVASREGGDASLQVTLLGPFAIRRDGVPLILPASRKVRALLAYLVLAPHPMTRSHLCELLWDVPNDPRGELRWCLSKIRQMVDEPDRRRVETDGDTIRIDLSDCRLDAIEVTRAIRQGIATLAPERLHALSDLFAGDFLEGLEIERSPMFTNWLTSQRRHFRSGQAALLEHLVRYVEGNEVFAAVERWLKLAPFDRHAHQALLDMLARQGRMREGEEHLAAAARLFEAEGLDPAPIREAWRAARVQAARVPQGHVIVAPPIPASDRKPEDVAPSLPRRASVAIMPFVDSSAEADAPAGPPIRPPAGPAGGLAHDVITRLAKLRGLFVIAQGTVFALRERGIPAEAAGRMLDVDYVVSGWLQRQHRRLTVAVELAETRTARIVWAEVFDQPADDTFPVLDEIGNRIVASIAHEIEAHECNRAVLRPPNSLDAWEAHHRGLWHMYRFNRADNERAQHFFGTAVRLDPTFSRAYAGLSFTHFQNAFQGWAERASEIDHAFATAGQSLMADDRDPAAHWAMGRAHWLRGSLGRSLVELEEAIELSPNFALGHYTLAFVQAQLGDPEAAITSSHHSQLLSPFDPLLFGMLGARAMALLRLGRFEEAAACAIKAAARPNAHVHIFAIAAYSLALAGRLAEARSYRSAIAESRPRYSVEDFLAAMRFSPEDADLFRQAARRIG